VKRKVAQRQARRRKLTITKGDSLWLVENDLTMKERAVDVGVGVGVGVGEGEATMSE
jgi:hypothetical protein